MKIYIDTHVEELDWRKSLSLLPSWRQEKVLKYRRVEDKRLSVAVWLLLRRACREVMEWDDVPEVKLEENGKPGFVHHPNVYFNLSHTDGAAVCVMNVGSAVGIDIEAVRPVDEEVMRHVMDEKEQMSITTAERPDVAFARLWTMKESLLKCTGAGLTDSLPTLLHHTSRFQMTTFVTEDGRFVYSVCISAAITT